ncbi:hypothetical protein BaRGS_00036595, partial [Batillaria attramentaria]
TFVCVCTFNQIQPKHLTNRRKSLVCQSGSAGKCDRGLSFGNKSARTSGGR